MGLILRLFGFLILLGISVSFLNEGEILKAIALFVVALLFLFLDLGGKDKR